MEHREFMGVGSKIFVVTNNSESGSVTGLHLSKACSVGVQPSPSERSCTRRQRVIWLWDLAGAHRDWKVA